MKRNRGEHPCVPRQKASRLDQQGSFQGSYYDQWLAHLTNRDALYLRDNVLKRENVYGYAYNSCPKTSQPFYRFLLVEKEKHPRDLLLVQHGDFFNLWGVDAIFGVEFGGLTVHRKKTPCREKTLRCSTQRATIQALLDKLVTQRFNIRVYEQTGDRHHGKAAGPMLRECTQLVNQAVPHFYPYSSCLDTEIGDRHAPVLFVFPDALLRIDVVNHSYRIFSQLCPTSLRCALESFCQVSPEPICFASLETVRLYQLQHYEVFDDTIEYRECVHMTAVHYSYDPVVFTEEKQDAVSPLPLLHCTMSHLGLSSIRTGGSCGFVEHIAGTQCRPLERAFLRRWLSYPRPTAARSMMEECVADIHRGVQIVDTDPPLNPHSVLHRMVSVVHNPNPDAHRGKHQPHFLHQLYTHLLKRRDHAATTGVTCWDLGVVLPFETYKVELTEIERELRDHLLLENPPLVSGFPVDAVSRSEVYLVSAATLAGVTTAKQKFVQVLAGRDYLGVGSEHLGLVSGDVGDEGITMYQCPELSAAYQEYRAACLASRDEQYQMVTELVTRLYRSYHNTLRVFLFGQVTAQAIHRHLQHVAPRRWQRVLVEAQDHPPDQFGFEGLYPVWANPVNYSVNDVQLSRGQLTILTAPNASGKTTLLRAITGALLLANAGLLCPCTRARVPEVDSLVLKIGCTDSGADHRLSSFEAEMHDMNLILQTTSSRSFVALDEIGRATSYAEGLAVNQALVERLHSQVGYLFVSTHMYELLDEFPMAKRRTLLPGYSYRDGETRDSGSLAICSKFSIDPKVVERARSLLLKHRSFATPPYEQEKVSFEKSLTILSIARHITNSDPIFIPLGTLPPPCTIESCCVYLINEGRTQDCWYVGETKNVTVRQLQHRSKGREGPMWVYRVQNKTIALQYESLILKECVRNRIRVSNVNDSLC